MRYLVLATLVAVGCNGGDDGLDPMCRVNAFCTLLDAYEPTDGPVDARVDGPLPAIDQALCDAINTYRVDRGLAPIAVGAGLGQVARLHVVDLVAHPPSGACNLHSWSTGDPRWTGCCYTADHAQAQCMWEKPREIAQYDSSGYEIAAGGGGSIQPAQAVALWDGSNPHREVILNQGIWAGRTWRAIGCAIENGYAVVWFGELAP